MNRDSLMTEEIKGMIGKGVGEPVTLVVEASAVRKFIEAVEMLIEDSNFASRLGLNARRTVEEKFSLNRMIEEYSAFYRELSRR